MWSTQLRHWLADGALGGSGGCGGGGGGRGRKDKVLRGGLPVCVLSHQPAAQTAHPSGLAPDAHS